MFCICFELGYFSRTCALMRSGTTDKEDCSLSPASEFVWGMTSRYRIKTRRILAPTAGSTSRCYDICTDRVVAVGDGQTSNKLAT